MPTSRLSFIGFLLALTCLGAGCRSVPTVPVVSSKAPVIEPASLNQELLDMAFKTRDSWSIPSSTRVAIVPHHLIAARPLASLFDGLPKAKTIFVVSPDHFSQGKTAFTTTDQAICLNEGCTSVRSDLVQELRKKIPELKVSSTPFVKEHGVFTLLPFLHRANPEAKIVPIIVRIDASDEVLERLSKTIESMMQADPSSVLVASIDMSHYQTQEVADFHDEMTVDRLTQRCVSCVRSLELDSPGSAYVATHVATALSLNDARTQSHTNSLRLGKAMVERSSTSHLVLTYSTSDSVEPTSQATSTIRTEFWHTLPKIVTEEDRLYRGYDEERVFKTMPFPVFFGIVHDHKGTHIYPFPYDAKRQLLTRQVREAWILKNMPALLKWLRVELGTSTVEMVISY